MMIYQNVLRFWNHISGICRFHFFSGFLCFCCFEIWRKLENGELCLQNSKKTFIQNILNYCLKVWNFFQLIINKNLNFFPESHCSGLYFNFLFIFYLVLNLESSLFIIYIFNFYQSFFYMM